MDESRPGQPIEELRAEVETKLSTPVVKQLLAYFLGDEKVIVKLPQETDPDVFMLRRQQIRADHDRETDSDKKATLRQEHRDITQDEETIGMMFHWQVEDAVGWAASRPEIMEKYMDETEQQMWKEYTLLGIIFSGLKEGLSFYKMDANKLTYYRRTQFQERPVFVVPQPHEEFFQNVKESEEDYGKRETEHLSSIIGPLDKPKAFEAIQEIVGLEKILEEYFVKKFFPSQETTERGFLSTAQKMDKFLDEYPHFQEADE